MRTLIGTSWKMHLTSVEADRWFRTVIPLVAGLADRDIFVLPPFTSLWVARERLAGTGIAWGAQDVHPEDSGAHTGDVSAPMLADLGCTFVEVGHSERRRDHGETPDLIASKVAAVLRHRMRPILCVGEPEPVAADAAAATVVGDLAACLGGTDDSALARVVVAYEPQWAIGSGASAAPRPHVVAVHRAIHAWLARRTGNGPNPVIYGGSVDADEAGGLLAERGVDGLFVGRHALDPGEFARIAAAGHRGARGDGP